MYEVSWLCGREDEAFVQMRKQHSHIGDIHFDVFDVFLL